MQEIQKTLEIAKSNNLSYLGKQLHRKCFISEVEDPGVRVQK
jgi:hypothetical protein